MPTAIEQAIEQHRRDPSPHPRLEKRVATLEQTVATTGDGVALGSTRPSTVRTGQTSEAGTALTAARADHQHQLDLPADMVTATQVQQVAQAAAGQAAGAAVTAHVADGDPHPQYLRDEQASPFGLSVLAMAAFAAGGLLIGAGAGEPTVLAPAAGVLTSAGGAPSWSQSLDLDGPAILGDDPGGAYNLRVMGGARVRGNSGSNTPFALFDGVAGGSTSLWDANDIMPGGVNTPRTMQRWIANGTGGYAYGAVWDLCGGSTGALYGDNREVYANTLTWRSRTSADGFAFAADAMTLHGDGLLEAQVFDALAGGQALHLRPGTVDHCYLSFFPRTATPGTRGGYLGFGSAGGDRIDLYNERPSGGMLFHAATGHVFSDAVSGDPGGSETIRTSGAARLGSVLSNLLRAQSTYNLHLDAGTGSAATYINYYQGTGGVQFCNGAGSVVAGIDSAGNFSGRQVTAYKASSVVGETQYVAQGYQGGYGAGLSAYSQLSGSGANAKMGDLVFDGEAAWSSADAATQRAYFRLRLAYNGSPADQVIVHSNGMLAANRITDIPVNGGMYGDCNVMLQGAAGGSVAALGFHRPGASGAAIFHSGDGAGLLRLMRWAGGDYRIYHSGTDDVIHRISEGSGYYQAPDWIQFTQDGQGVYWSGGAGAAIYKAVSNYLYIRTSGAVAYVDQTDTIRGYVYHDGAANNFGFLHANGQWGVRIAASTTGVYIDQGYFIVGSDPGGSDNLRVNGSAWLEGRLLVNGTNPYVQFNQAGVPKSYIQWLDASNRVDYYSAGSHRFMGAVAMAAALTMEDDIVLGSGTGLYHGDRLTDGTWRAIKSSTDLVFQYRAGGAYSTKFTVASTGIIYAPSMVLTYGLSCNSLSVATKITVPTSVPASFADLTAVRNWLAANFT